MTLVKVFLIQKISHQLYKARIQHFYGEANGTPREMQHKLSMAAVIQ